MSSGSIATPKTDNVVPFLWDDEGKSLPIEWGLDLAQLNEGYLRRGLLFAGKDLIDVVRVSFRPSDSNADGTLSEQQDSFLTVRANLVKTYCKSDVVVNINDDHAIMGSTYMCNSSSASALNACATEWAKCIDVHRLAYLAKGITIESVSPINETDDPWNGQISTNTDIRKSIFARICKQLRDNYGYTDLGIHLVGGNTLNNDYALSYWEYLKEYLAEGNTHQLAGSFDTYAAFFPAVVAGGHKATNDELHNVMECMVGAEYGMQRGIWWGTCEHTRSQFMKASNNGVRLAYSENRAKWTAASVYRHADGTVEGFVGASERQATQTTYRFVSLDRDVWYDGHGPMREYVVTVESDPNGEYQSAAQCNRENLINIQTGEDIQPIIDGSYKIANRANISLTLSSSATLTPYSSGAKWSVTPHDKDWVGDICYHCIKVDNSATNPTYLDVRDWSLESGADVIAYVGGFGSNEQWYLRYAGDGCFYIMSRHNAMCLQPKGGSVSDGMTLVTAPVTGANYQKWRFLPTNLTTYSSSTPSKVSEFAVESGAGSVKLTWNYPYNRRTGYTKTNYSFNVLRRVKGETEWQMLAQGLTVLAFTDNTAVPEVQYEYAIRTRFSHTGIRSTVTSDVLEGSVTDAKSLLGWWCTGDSLQDATVNGNHAALCGTETYVSGKIESTKALSLNGTSFVQLPATIASRGALTFAAWVYWTGGNNWQRIFDFGTDETHYMFLTPTNGSGMRLVFNNGGSEQVLNTTTLKTNTWVHVAATVDAESAALYVNGVKVSSKNVGIVPSDFNPIFNYIGRSQFSADPMFRGRINDARIYNYALSADDVSTVYQGGDPTGIELVPGVQALGNVVSAADGNEVYDLSGRRVNAGQKGIVIKNNKKYYNR